MNAQYIDHLKRAQQCLASGELAQAASSCELAIGIQPASAEAWNLRGLIAARQGESGPAIAHFRAALKYAPRSPVIHNNLGAAYMETQALDQALACFRTAVECHPGYAVAHKNLGQVYHERGELDAAAKCFNEALVQNPQYAPAHSSWANMLYAQGDLPVAATHYQQALALQDDPDTRMRLANTLDGMGHHQRASELYLQVAAAQPDYPGVQNNLGQTLFELGRTDEAIACFRKAIAQFPENPIAHNSLGNAFSKLGMPGKAIECFRAALAIDPDYANAHSNLLLNMNYIVDQQRNIHAEALRFGERQTREYPDVAPEFENIIDTDRKLRIGYVSADFRNHSVAYFALPLLEAHDRDRFEIFCYANNPRQDDMTERFRSLADRWVNIRGLPDDSVAAQIRRDAVDILVDLSGHTADNRLRVFSRRPAPVTVNWLGYPNTTGLPAMDYRVTDPIADPVDPDVDERYSERLVRLPGGFLCYRSDPRSAPVSPPPETERGYTTFGSFNMLAKIGPEVIAAWSEILSAVPGSRLLLKAHSLGSAATNSSLLASFAGHGIDAERIELMGMLPKAEHFRLYSRIDIALDTFPYNGTTTTCEAMWMGVPVITLSGSCHAGRVGASLLHQVGLTEFIAHDRASYLSQAQALAGNPELRGLLRSKLRERMLESFLMNPSAFARQMEDAFRNMWTAWCAEYRQA